MFQEISLIGNLGRDPEMRYTPAGEAVTNFSIAVNKKYTDKSGTKVEKVTWFRISVWGKAAEACNQYLSKGRQVFVKGELIPDENGNPRLWTDNSGVTRASFEVNARQVLFLGSKSDSTSQTYPGSDTYIPGFDDLDTDGLGAGL